MTTKRFNFRNIRDRFTHIDATLVACNCLPGADESRYVVRFYAWWEHPLYRAAIKSGENWGFTDVDEGARDVTVIAKNTCAVHLSTRANVTDWDFCEAHPALWRYEDRAEIFCNSNVDREALFDRVLARRLPFVDAAVLSEHLGLRARYTAPYSLGYFPHSLFTVIRAELEDMGARLQLPRLPERKETPVLFLIDGEDYVIADDFDLEVPEFEHRPEWFKR